MRQQRCPSNRHVRQHMLLRKQNEDLLSFAMKYWTLVTVFIQPGTNMLIPALRSFWTKAEVPMLGGCLVAHGDLSLGYRESSSVCRHQQVGKVSNGWKEQT